MKTLRERLNDINDKLFVSDMPALLEIAKQMDALLEECAFALGKCMNLDLHEEGEIGHKLREAGYGQ